MTDYMAYQKRSGDLIRTYYLSLTLPDFERAETVLLLNGWTSARNHQSPFVCRTPEETIAYAPEAGPRPPR